MTIVAIKSIHRVLLLVSFIVFSPALPNKNNYFTLILLNQILSFLHQLKKVNTVAEESKSANTTFHLHLNPNSFMKVENSP